MSDVEVLTGILKQHAPWPGVGGDTYRCECGEVFENTLTGPDPRDLWARHVAEAIQGATA